MNGKNDREILKACLSRFFAQTKTAHDLAQGKTSLLNRSLYVTIINCVVKLNENDGVIVKHEKPYSFEDKIALNGIAGELKERMTGDFYLSFDAINSAFDVLSQFDVSVKTKFLTVIGNLYSEYLIRNGLGRDDVEKIRARRPTSSFGLRLRSRKAWRKKTVWIVIRKNCRRIHRRLPLIPFTTAGFSCRWRRSMIIDYDGKPQNSVFYTAALLYKHIRDNGFKFDEAYDFFINSVNKNPMLFYYSLDWLYMIGKIKLDGGMLICD